MSRCVMNNKGSVLVSYLMISLLLGLAASVSVQSLSERRKAKRNEYSNQAFWLAEAGAHRAKWEYNTNDCVGMVEQGTQTACTDCTCNNAVKEATTSLGSIGTYTVTLNVANDTVTSSAVSPVGGSEQITQSIQVGLAGAPQVESLFTHAAYAVQNVTIKNYATVDSYNSALGAYGGANVASNGDVGTNFTGSNAVYVYSYATIDGDVSVGNGGVVNQQSNSTITGSITYENNRTLNDIIIPPELTTLTDTANYSGNFHVGNYGLPDSVTLNGGDYKMRGMNLHNGATVTIDGDVRIYMWHWSSNLSTGNNSNLIITPGSSLTVYGKATFNFNHYHNNINQNADPSKFIIYNDSRVPSQGTRIGAKAGRKFEGVVYAPHSDIYMWDDAQVHGSLVGRKIEMRNNTGLHYDENLQNLPSPFGSSGGGGSAPSGGDVTFDNWLQIQ